MKVGDRQFDPDGSEWIIVGVVTENGAESYSRVRAGSLAALVHGHKEAMGNTCDAPK